VLLKMHNSSFRAENGGRRQHESCDYHYARPVRSKSSANLDATQFGEAVLSKVKVERQDSCQTDEKRQG
jgi:hypothetical protein